MKHLVRRDHFMRPFNDLMEEFTNKFFESPAKVLEGVKHKAYPKINVFTEPDAIVIEASVPGLTKDQVEVSLKGNELTITGKDTHTESDIKRDYFYREISHTAFSRMIWLPEDCKVKAKDLKAKVENGLLHVRVPYKKHEKEIVDVVPVE